MQTKLIKARALALSEPSDKEFESLHPIFKKVLRSRNIQSSHDIDHSLKHLLAPTGLKGIEAATDRIIKAIEQQQHILIVGDYDADGATSTALAIKGLRAMGAQHVNYSVPNRFSYGYGLSLKLAQEISQNPPDLVVTVDNGISSVEGVDHLKQHSIDVLITDHHLAGEHIPDAVAIVNPNQPGCQFESKMLAGVGVMFYLILSVNKSLQSSGYYTKHALKPDILALLDLVALGTVADVVPLDRNNRILVAQGVARMRAGKMRPGIAALMQVAKRDVNTLLAQDLGFVVGPRLNAAGRLEDISSGIECLLADDATHAQQLAIELNEINSARKDIEQSMQKQAVKAVNSLQFDGSPSHGVVLYDDAWHEGVVGLVASRIKDKIGVPVLAFAKGEGGGLKGSARSIKQVHIRDVLANINVQNPNLIERFGGHAMAAGLTITAENLDDFKLAFEAHTAEILAASPPSNTILTDGELKNTELNKAFANSIKTLIPWGQTCPEPQFEGEFKVLNCRFVGQIHLKLVLTQNGSNNPIDAILFRYIDSGDSDQKRAALELTKIRAVYSLDVNHFRGQSNLQLIIHYLEPV